MRLTEIPTEELMTHLTRGREKVREAKAGGKAVPTWEVALAELEAELAHRRQVEEITRLMQEHGWALVWSDTLGEVIAFANDDQAAAQVPGGIIVYTRAEMANVIGVGPDTLRLVHEGKKLGAKVTGRSKADG